MGKDTSNKFKNLSKNMGLFTISNFGSRIISFMLIPLSTSVLSTQEYGSVDLMSTTAALLMPLMTISIQDAVLRFTLDKRYKSQEVISIGFKINAIASILFIAALCLLWCLDILRQSVDLTIFLFLTFMMNGLNGCFTVYLKGTERISILVISGLTNTLVTCVLNLYLLLVVGMGLQGYLIANLFGQAIAACIQFFGAKIYKDIHLRINLNLAKEMIRYSAPLIVNSISWWINNSIDRYILILFRGIAENGILSVAYKIPTILSTIQGIFYNAWSISAITEYDPEDKDGFLGKTYTLYNVLSIVSCSVILIFNRPLAKILYAKDFFRAWQAVPFFLVGTVFSGIAVFQGCLFAATKQTREVSKSTIIGAMINTAGNLICVYFFGVVGAAFATMLGYIVVWVIRTIKLNQFIQLKVNWKLHLLSCLLLVVQSFLALNESFIVLEVLIFMLLLVLQKSYIYMIVVKLNSMLKGKISSRLS